MHVHDHTVQDPDVYYSCCRRDYRCCCCCRCSRVRDCCCCPCCLPNCMTLTGPSTWRPCRA
jgi:hypothetical protein